MSGLTEVIDNLVALIEVASKPNLPWGRILAVPALLGLCAIGAWFVDRRDETAKRLVARRPTAG